ncbi:MAG: glycine cleavage system protein H [Desulfobulbaceae bacterium BRH_c16a]|nr:MAG: glycine cleavage system protein H [Desulfobulbaceae bacterium BRH_c16a]
MARCRVNKISNFYKGRRNVKELNELIFKDELRYTEDHEWVTAKGNTLKVGISDYAQDQLGDIVFVELPEVGATYEKGEEFGTLESVKAVSELYLPIGGEVVAVNEDLGDSPELINQDAYKNWIIEIKPHDTSELEQLLTVDAYREILKG